MFELTVVIKVKKETELIKKRKNLAETQVKTKRQH
jgi:hypothetical protein